MQLSVVTTLYQSAPYVDEFYRRLRTELEKITSDFEIVFVNDGSTDQSLDVALDFQKEDVRIRVIFDRERRVLSSLRKYRGRPGVPFI
ncbi:MAG: hypothetical protein DMF01_04550 [Verrucomicrobia bacterium]|nr:MAG: hypothetical protein DMF01_04550 [Verrucomicrobiota bacterium]